ncbi:hypothetical protein I7E32_00075 [Alcaligenes faecalis]|uniref:hypothetical protein n=1 Tax=Alcaligenes faecalis TaxID=511 RepID=UPI0018D04E0F|nr:hypothetical protein [Alcaligenes faecalis]MBH0308753.1 hypothetical protein [Alcaligenes faecalis]USP49528.1 hypothetical protein J5J84_08660 [Alcaligenes faecalis]
MNIDYAARAGNGGNGKAMLNILVFAWLSRCYCGHVEQFLILGMNAVLLVVSFPCPHRHFSIKVWLLALISESFHGCMSSTHWTVQTGFSNACYAR